MTREEWIASADARRRGFHRAGSIRIRSSREGYGTAPSIHDYPHQQVDVNTESYDYGWLEDARADALLVRDGIFEAPAVPAGNLKFFREHTPLLTQVAELVRTGGETE